MNREYLAFNITAQSYLKAWVSHQAGKAAPQSVSVHRIALSPALLEFPSTSPSQCADITISFKTSSSIYYNFVITYAA